jgi:hypothetical protein
LLPMIGIDLIYLIIQKPLTNLTLFLIGR